MLEKTKETKNKVTAAKKVEKWEKLDAELTKILSKTGLDKYKKWSQVLRNKTKCQQGDYSLRRPPKLIIPQIFIEQIWANVYEFMCNRICKSKQAYMTKA